jgi:hypothetical protein
LATSAKPVQIGSGTIGSAMGRLRIAAANRGKGIYKFAFANWTPATAQNPVAIIGGRSIVAATGRAQTANGVSIVRAAKR